MTDPLEALKPGAPQVHAPGNLHVYPNHLDTTAFSRGDVDEALAKADIVFDQLFQTQTVEVAFLEPEACLALPQGKGVKVYSQSQGSAYDHKDIARILKLPMEDVEVELASSGGAFGAKEDLTIQGQTALAAFASAAAGEVRAHTQAIDAGSPEAAPHFAALHGGCGRRRPPAGRARADGRRYRRVFEYRREVPAARSVPCDGRLQRAERRYSGHRRVHEQSGQRRDARIWEQSGAIRHGRLHGYSRRKGRRGWLRYSRAEYSRSGRSVLHRADHAGERRGNSQVARSREGHLQKLAKYAGIGCGIKSTGLGNGMVDAGHVTIKVLKGGNLEVRTGHTEMGQGLFTATRQVVCEETGISPDKVVVGWDKDLGSKTGETWASRGTTLTSAAARQAGAELAAELKTTPIEQLVGRVYKGDYVCNFTTKPGTPEAKINPTTHLTFSYATQVVILDDDGKLKRVVAAHDVGHAINPKGCAGQIEGGVHMGLGYALSETFESQGGVPETLNLRDLGILQAKDTPPIDVILVEVPDEIGGYGAKGAGEIGLVPTAGAVAGALYSYDRIRRTRLPMEDAPAALPSVPKARKAKAAKQAAERARTELSAAD